MTATDLQEQVYKSYTTFDEIFPRFHIQASSTTLSMNLAQYSGGQVTILIAGCVVQYTMAIHACSGGRTARDAILIASGAVQ